MKRLFTLNLFLAMAVSVLAQAPQKMSYQAVIRNNSGQLVASHSVGMRISILQGSAAGTPVYVETHTATTNANGLATIEIGSGSVVSGSFTGINWASGTYFIKTETDPAGGTSYTITGTSPLLSVPYSLYSKSAGNGSLWTQNGVKISYNNGDVGIGVSNPSAFLDVLGDCNLNHPLLLLTENQYDYARMMFKNSTLPTKNWTIATLTNETDYNSIMNFYYNNGTTGKNIMTIEGTGRVGIGLNNPSELLHVYGVANPRILVQSPDQAPELNLQRGNTFHALYVNGNYDLAFYCDGDRMALTHDGKLGIGTTAPNYTLDVRGTIGNNTTLYHSDLRWKKDIQPMKYGVSDLVKLNSVSYLWNANDYPDMGFDKETQFGFIAQEFEKVIPELVRTDKDGYKSIDYVKLTPVLVEAIKEQQKQIDELKSLVTELSARLSAKSE